jgi:hypothetical protein
MNDEQEKASRIRRWVKLTVIVLAVAVLITIAMRMIGGPGHGPLRHFSASAAVRGQR